jgi:hypothetical protein
MGTRAPCHQPNQADSLFTRSVLPICTQPPLTLACLPRTDPAPAARAQVQQLAAAQTDIQLVHAMARYKKWKKAVPATTQPVLVSHLVALDFIPVLQRHLRRLTGCPAQPAPAAPPPVPPANGAPVAGSSGGAEARGTEAAAAGGACARDGIPIPAAEAPARPEAPGVAGGGPSEGAPPADAAAGGGSHGGGGGGALEAEASDDAKADIVRGILLAWGELFCEADLRKDPSRCAPYLAAVQQVVEDPAPLLRLLAEGGAEQHAEGEFLPLPALLQDVFQIMSIKACALVNSASAEAVDEAAEAHLRLTRALNREQPLRLLVELVRRGKRGAGESAAAARWPALA